MSTNNPFYTEFEYGANKEGYWNYELMVLQLEDCTDCTSVLYPNFDFIFLFDHSCGHDKQREDGLNAENMAKGYGGKQSKLRDTKILTKIGYLGDFPSQLKEGDIQSMQYHEEDDGPFYLNAAERIAKKYDKPTGKKKQRKYIKGELLAMLKSKGFELPPGTHVKKVEEKCAELGVSIKTPEEDAIAEGWMGKPKGMMQVLWEHGYIDETHLKQYTVNGKKDAYGVIDLSTSLKNIVANCTDFA